jgi:glycosyltransferase involved in cell wall biosynthesis
MIHHKQDGYVAQYRDADDLASGIRYVLSHPELSEMAASYAHATYNEHRVAQLYLQEYER